MRVVALALLLLGAAEVSLPAQQRADAERVKQQFVGSYKLMSYVTYDQNGAPTKLPYTVGQISYDAAGRMSAQLMGDDRKNVTGSRASEAERAALYSTYISYFGRYEVDVDKGTVTHLVEGGLSPNMVGSAMVRYFEFSPDGRSLFLSLKSGERMTGKLQWDRYR
jgi:hypothetical protein